MKAKKRVRLVQVGDDLWVDPRAVLYVAHLENFAYPCVELVGNALEPLGSTWSTDRIAAAINEGIAEQ